MALHPQRTARHLVEDPHRFREGTAACLLMGVLYTISVFVGYLHGFGAVMEPWLPIWDPVRWRRLDEEYGRHRSEEFRNWRLPITGLVARPRELSLDEIRGLPARTQITAHVCESGWSAIGEWTGTPLQRVLEAAGGVTPAARYVVIDTFDPGYYESYDLFEVEHPQTILAYGLNGRDLPTGNGAPLRLRVERQCGYKNLRWVKSIQVVDSVAGFGLGTGGRNSDLDWQWFAGV